MSYSSSEIVLSPNGVLALWLITAHSAFQKPARQRAQTFVDYAIALAAERGYPKAAHLRALFQQPDVQLLVAEVEPLAQYVNVAEVFAHFGFALSSVQECAS